jgi:hypothetical protein
MSYFRLFRSINFDKKDLGVNIQITTDDSNTSQAVVDDPACELIDIFLSDLIKPILNLKDNVNPLGSIESRDDIDSSDGSDNEGKFDNSFHRFLSFVSSV